MKLKLFTAALALGLAASASADTTTRVAYDEETQTVTTVADTSVTSEVTAAEAGILSNANPTDRGNSTYWVENTVAFTLDLDALRSYVDSGESDTLSLVTFTTSNSHTVGVYMTSDGTIGLMYDGTDGPITSGDTTTLSDLVSSGLTTLVCSLRRKRGGGSSLFQGGVWRVKGGVGREGVELTGKGNSGGENERPTPSGF